MTDQHRTGEAKSDRLDDIDEALLMLGCSGCLSDAEERLRQICCELSAERRRVRDHDCDELGCDMFGCEEKTR